MDTGLSGIPDPLAQKAEVAFTNVKGALFALFDDTSSEKLALPIQVLVADQLANVLEQARMGNPLGAITDNVRSGNAPLALGSGTPTATVANEDTLLADQIRNLASQHGIEPERLMRNISAMLAPLAGLPATEVNAKLTGMAMIADGTTDVEPDGSLKPFDPNPGIEAQRDQAVSDRDTAIAERDQAHADLADAQTQGADDYRNNTVEPMHDDLAVAIKASMNRGATDTIRLKDLPDWVQDRVNNL